MSDEILSLIYTFSKKFNDPETNLSFDPKNQNISAIIKNGNANISLIVKGININHTIIHLKKFRVSGGTSNKVAYFPTIKFPDQNKAAKVRKE